MKILNQHSLSASRIIVYNMHRVSAMLHALVYQVVNDGVYDVVGCDYPLLDILVSKCPAESTVEIFGFADNHSAIEALRSTNAVTVHKFENLSSIVGGLEFSSYVSKEIFDTYCKYIIEAESGSTDLWTRQFYYGMLLECMRVMDDSFESLSNLLNPSALSDIVISGVSLMSVSDALALLTFKRSTTLGKVGEVGILTFNMPKMLAPFIRQYNHTDILLVYEDIYFFGDSTRSWSLHCPDGIDALSSLPAGLRAEGTSSRAGFTTSCDIQPKDLLSMMEWKL